MQLFHVYIVLCAIDGLRITDDKHGLVIGNIGDGSVLGLGSLRRYVYEKITIYNFWIGPLSPLFRQGGPIP